MSDHEFENYLALVSRLLRLSGKHRELLAGELRSHLEDRLEELLAQGMSRELAVRQALEEFGDAAGLAGQFLAISRNRKRRWLMRLTTFSVAAMVLLAAGLAIFWPGRNAAPGVALVVAQAPDDAAKSASPPPRPPAATPQGAAKLQTRAKASSAVQRIEQELERTTELDVVEMPLKDVVLFLSDKHAIPIVLKAKKLDEASIPPDCVVTKSLRGIRLSSALNLVLEDLELTYLVKDEVLQITTLADANSTAEIRIYDCRDILAMQAPDRVEGLMGAVNEHDQRSQRLMMMIMTNVDPQTWQGGRMMGGGGYGSEVSGTPMSPSSGSISEYSGLIVVTQTAHTHQKVERLLDMLREAAGLEGKVGKVVR
jgi:hypothetical protein